MEASLPISAAVNAPAPRVAASQASVGDPSVHAPSILLPLRFMMTGLLALITGVALLAARPDLLATYHYNQYVIALTHLWVLGWICTIVMGAMYQLVPVALETKLYSERLARWQFVLHLVGFAGMVWMFWKWDLKQVGHFGSTLAVGVGLFAWNITRTLRRVPRWNVIATAVASALVWMCLTILAGLTIAAGKCTYESAASASGAGVLGGMLAGLKASAAFVGRFDQLAAMHAHAHLGAVGIFIMLIVGISYKLVPMFTLSEVQAMWRARASIWLLNAGLAASFFCILLRSRFKPLAAGLIVLGLILYGLEMRAIIRARKRRTLDWGIKYFLTAISLLIPLSMLGLALSWPTLPLNAFTGQLENLYGFLGLAGVVSFAIVGMLYKILPFLVWYRAYSRQIGQSKVPSLADLYSARLQAAGYWIYLGALAVIAAGIVLGNAIGVRAGAILLGCSLLILAVNAASILSHLVRPRIQPLPARAAATSTL